MERGNIIPDLERKLRRQESTFQQWKKQLLGVGIFQITLAGFFAFLLYKFHWKFEGSDGAVLTALFVGVTLLSLGVGVFLVTVCIRDWRGNVARLLLLQMCDRENDETTPDKP